MKNTDEAIAGCASYWTRISRQSAVIFLAAAGRMPRATGELLTGGGGFLG